VALLGRTRFRVAVSFAVFALGAAVAPPASAQRGLEYEVKAAFLYNFIQFVEWPPSVFADKAAPFPVCLYGDDPFGPALARTVSGERLAGHPVIVERVPVGGAVTQCRLLFIPQSQATRVQAVLRAAGDAPVLVVGESPDFLRSGGVIYLFVEGGRVRFDVSVPAASRRGLTISSKLLRIARSTSSGVEP
jgi:hypothetical protein